MAIITKQSSPAYRQDTGEENKGFPASHISGIAVILAILLIRFFRTIVFGKSISKLFLLGHWDPCFFAFRAGQNFLVDGSLLLLHMPYRFFVAQCWRHAIPLWNNLSGFGMPLLADPQAFVLSPLYAIFFAFPTMYVWNQTIIIELAIGAISTYLLCLELDFGFIAALSSGLLFSFCPWVQWQGELIGNGICLTPFVFLFFVKAARHRALFYTIIAGIAAAVDLLAAHPEMSLMTIIFAVALMYISTYKQSPANFSLFNIFYRIGLSGLVAFGLAAPLLIPFAEYLLNGYTYKLCGVAPANITWQALLANYFYPFHTEGNLFWGPLSWLGLAGLIFLPFRQTRFAISILVCFILSILATAKVFPLNILFSVAPFSYVESIYCLPEYVVFVSILSGIGIGSLITYSKNSTRKRLLAFVFLAMVPAVVSALLSQWHPIDSWIRTDQAANFRQFSWKFWSTNTYCLAGLLFVWALIRNQHLALKASLKHLSIIAFTILGVWNLFFISRNALPIRPSFNYPQISPIQIDKDSRFLTVGSHLFRHNTGLIYQMHNVQTHNPLLPNNFVEYMEACGAQVNDRFSQIFSPMISRKIDVTGTS